MPRGPPTAHRRRRRPARCRPACQPSDRRPARQPGARPDRARPRPRGSPPPRRARGRPPGRSARAVAGLRRQAAMRRPSMRFQPAGRPSTRNAAFEGAITCQPFCWRPATGPYTAVAAFEVQAELADAWPGSAAETSKLRLAQEGQVRRDLSIDVGPGQCAAPAQRAAQARSPPDRRRGPVVGTGSRPKRLHTRAAAGLSAYSNVYQGLPVRRAEHQTGQEAWQSWAGLQRYGVRRVPRSAGTLRVPVPLKRRKIWRTAHGARLLLSYRKRLPRLEMAFAVPEGR